MEKDNRYFPKQFRGSRYKFATVPPPVTLRGSVAQLLGGLVICAAVVVAVYLLSKI